MPFLNYIKCFGLAVIMMSHKTVLPSDLERVFVKWHPSELNNVKQINATLKYFQYKIMEQILDDVNASNLECTMTGDAKVPTFDDSNNKKDRWQGNIDFNCLTKMHQQDIVAYVNEKMTTQSNQELKKLLMDNDECDFISVLAKMLSYIGHTSFMDEVSLRFFIHRLCLIKSVIKSEPECLQLKKKIDWRERFLWPKLPLLVYRYFFKSSACDDEMFKKFILACYACDNEKNTWITDLHEPRMLESFSDFDQLTSKKDLGELNLDKSTEVILLLNIRIDHIKSLINFFMNSRFAIIEKLIRDNNTIDFIACLNRLSRFYDLQQTELEKILAKDNFSKVEEQWNTMVQNVQIVDDCVRIQNDIYDNRVKIQAQKWQLFCTWLVTLFLLYYGSKKLYGYTN